MNVQEVQVVNAPGAEHETRHVIRAGVQHDKIYFEITSPVYVGDQIEADDPRGGTRKLAVTNVKLFDQRSNPAFAGMSYLLASVEDVNDRARNSRDGVAAHQVFNGPVINMSGGRANVAWDKGTVVDGSKHSEISPGFEDLALRLTEAIQLMRSIDDLDEEDRQSGEEAASLALQEITKNKPDRKVLKSLLLTVKGVLTSAAGSALGGTAKDLVASLIA